MLVLKQKEERSFDFFSRLRFSQLYLFYFLLDLNTWGSIDINKYQTHEYLFGTEIMDDSVDIG